MEFLRSSTIDTVVATEKEAKAIEEAFKDKREQLKADNEQAVETHKSEADDILAKHKDDLQREKASELESFKEAKDNENQETIQKMDSDFQAKKSELINYVVGEVKKVYGNS